MVALRKKLQYLHLSNAVLMGNLASVLLGSLMTKLLFEHRSLDPKLPWFPYFHQYIDHVAIGLAVGLTLWYEGPIRASLKAQLKNHPLPPQARTLAQKRILNEPYALTFMAAAVWSLSILIFYLTGASATPEIGIASGMFSLTLAFFWMEYINQNHLIPLFFKKTAPSQIKGTITIKVWGRFAALIFAVSIVPFAFILITIRRFKGLQTQPGANLPQVMEQMETAITTEALIFLISGICLAWVMRIHFKKPLREIIRVLGQVKKGNFQDRAQIFSVDEIGFAGEALNDMTKGLAERELIKDSFGKYVDRRIRDEILAGNIPLDGELKQATLLLADLRNFTPLVAVSDPKELIHVLNAYFNA
ncbi:MAG: HAMP domain-containing protein, partial [Desulfovibrionales bacterium]|nr:HAMP domain-containing protein [Desulfovibrionales bacterium]